MCQSHVEAWETANMAADVAIEFIQDYIHPDDETLGAYHLTENFESSGWKVNGKVTFRKFQPKIEEYVLR